MRRYRARARIALFASLLSGTTSAEVVRLETLTARAVSRRAAIAAARARTAAAVSSVDVAAGSALPRVGFDLEGAAAPGGKLVRIEDVQGNEYFVEGSRPLGEEEAFLPQIRYRGVVTVAGRLYDFGGTRAVVDAAAARASAASAGERSSVAAVLREVRVAYLRWILAHGADTLARRDVAVARERLATVEAAVEDGERPQAEIATAKYRASLAELEQSRSRSSLDGALIDLGLAVGEQIPVSGEPDLRLLEDGAPKRSRRQPSAALEAIRRRQAAALADARASERSRAPVLFGGVEAGASGQGDRLFPAYQIGVSLSAPLWDGGTSAARARTARAEAMELGAEAREHELALRAEATRARIDLESARHRVEIASSLVAAARLRERDADARHRLGEITLDEVFEVRSQRLRAEQELLSAKVGRLEASFRLAEPGVEAAEGQ